MQNEILDQASMNHTTCSGPPLHTIDQAQRSDEGSEISSPGPQSQSPSRLMHHGFPTGKSIVNPEITKPIDGLTTSVEIDRQDAQKLDRNEESSKKKGENRNELMLDATETTTTTEVEEFAANQTVTKKPIPQNDAVGGELPIVARLPSRNVSFQSAQILTLPELSKCVQEFSYKLIGIRDESSSQSQCTFQGSALIDVRITGVVLHMFMDANDQSFIILGDALFTPKSKIGVKSSLLQHRRNGISNSNITKAAATGTRTGTTPPTSNSTVGPPLSSSSNTSKLMIGTTLSGKKRRLVTVKPRTYNSLLHKQSNKLLPTNPLLRKNTNPTGKESSRSLLQPSGFSASKICHNIHQRDPKEEELIRKLRQGMHMVVVDVTDMACVDGCKMDDLVMAIGTLRFQCLDSSIGEQSAKEGRNEDKVKRMMEHIVKSSTTKESTAGSVHGGKLEARIIQVVNGTDMNLLQEALKMRRHCLKDFEAFGGRGQVGMSPSNEIGNDNFDA